MTTFAAGTATPAGEPSTTIQYAESPDTHFHPKGKPPSEHTLQVIREARAAMPFPDKKDFEEPSLQRVSTLNQKTGLYEVIPGIYQVRGLDLANITFIRGQKGWIVFDPMTSLETARAKLELINTEIETCRVLPWGQSRPT